MQVQDAHHKTQVSCKKEHYLFIKMINNNIMVFMLKKIKCILKSLSLMILSVVLFHKTRNNKNQVFIKIIIKIQYKKRTKNKKQIIKANNFRSK